MEAETAGIQESVAVSGGANKVEVVINDDSNSNHGDNNGVSCSSTPQEKKKRGRKPKAQTQTNSNSRSGKKAEEQKKEYEEDVCSLCYDGGDLVICDKKTCPKAFHPTCLGRDYAFFQTKGPWICGWHVCTFCEKPARFFCYSCTYSVCRGCIKEADFVCTGKNRGFCETCLQLVRMIEEGRDVNSDGVKVDFNDRETHEFLFKDYWLEIRDKLSLTLRDIQKAGNPYKDADFVKDIESDETFDEDDESSTSSDSGSDCLVDEGNVSMKKRRRSKTWDIGLPDDTQAEQEPSKKEKLALREFNGWASKELLEFIGYLKEDTEKSFSIFDVQRLLLQYIKENKLQDLRRKSVITCDERLQRLFGKPTVGRFEMLKLLESHFSSKQSSFGEASSTCETQEEAEHDNDYQVEFSGKKEKVSRFADVGRIIDKRRKSRKKMEEKASRPNPNDYAAINVHNIGLVYLRRTLIEDLLEDLSSFDSKVVGSFVRIRTSGVGNRQEAFHRLVQVLGTRKVEKVYYTGRKTTDIILEIMNLNKKEDVYIDAVANQDFTEEECKRLRQSVRCGFVTRPTVSDFEEKAKALHEAKLNDWFETELLRLSHLRDRASEKGLRKELRECVEKLQLLSSPEERARKIQEIPEVIADPNADLDYDSDDKEDKLKGNNQGTGSSPWNNSKRGWDSVQQTSGKIWDKNKVGTSSWGQSGRKTGHSITEDHGWHHDQRENNDQINNNSTWDLGEEKAGDEQFAGWDSQKQSGKMDDQSNTDKSKGDKNICETNGWPGAYAGKVSLDSSSEWKQGRDQAQKSIAMTELSTKPDQKEILSEADKIWHYKDPSGTIQGPFSMLQLRKWSMKGFFPIDLRIWKTHETQSDSILLTDAIAGNLQKPNNWEGKRQFDQTFTGNTTGLINDKLGTGFRGNGDSTWMGLEQDNNRLNWQKDSTNHESVGKDNSINTTQPGKSANEGWGISQSSGLMWATSTSTSTKEGLNGVPADSECTRKACSSWDAGHGAVDNPMSLAGFGGDFGTSSANMWSSSNITETSNSARDSLVGSQESWGAPKDSGALLVESSKSMNTGCGGGVNDGLGGCQLSETAISSNSGWGGSQTSVTPTSTNTGWGGSQLSETPGSMNPGWSGTQVCEAPPMSSNTGWGGSQISAAPPVSTNAGWGGSQVSEAPMLTNGNPSQGWGTNQCSNSSWKIPSVVTVETPNCSNEGWSGPQSSENRFSASLTVEPPKSTTDGWFGPQGSQNAWTTASVVESGTSTNQGWGVSPSSENAWATASVAEVGKSANQGWGALPSTQNMWSSVSEVGPSKSNNDGWGGAQTSEKSWTAPSVVEALKPTSQIDSSGPTEGWGGGSMLSGGWNQSGRADNTNKEKVAGTQPWNNYSSSNDSGSVGKFRNRPPHDGFRPARNSKKDIPCKFHGKGFCKRGTSCDFRHE